MFCFVKRMRINLRHYSSKLRPVAMTHVVLETVNSDAWRPPLMIMHGMLGSKQNWRSVSRALVGKINRKIINLDARNHGDSPHSKEHSFMHMTADIVYLMEQMNLEKVSVMGHSMGAKTFMYMALKYPKLVESAVVVDTSPISKANDFYAVDLILNAMRQLEIPKHLSIYDGREYAYTKLQSLVVSRKTLNFILMNLRKKPNGNFTWAANVESLYNNLKSTNDFRNKIAGLAPYKGRTMFICGDRSTFIDRKTFPEIQKIFPNSEVHWLNAGHLVHIEQPEKFVELLVQFLK